MVSFEQFHFVHRNTDAVDEKQERQARRLYGRYEVVAQYAVAAGRVELIVCKECMCGLTASGRGHSALCQTTSGGD